MHNRILVRQTGVLVAILAPVLAFSGATLAQSEAIVIPTKYDANRFVLTPKTDKDDTLLRLFVDTAGGSFLFDDSVEKFGLVPVSASDDSNPRVSLPTMIHNSWMPGIRGVGEGFEVASRKVQGRVSRLSAQLDGMVGQAWFAHKVIVLDYPGRSITVLRGHIPPHASGAKKTKLGFPVGENGLRTFHFPRITITVDGKEHDMLLETGATAFFTQRAMVAMKTGKTFRRGASFMAEVVIEQWIKAHPDWPVVKGADAETGRRMIRVPEVTIAGFTVGPIWFVERSTESYHDFTSQWTDKQVDGSIGGNILREFRILLHYPQGVAWFERPGDYGSSRVP